MDMNSNTIHNGGAVYRTPRTYLDTSTIAPFVQVRLCSRAPSFTEATEKGRRGLKQDDRKHGEPMRADHPMSGYHVFGRRETNRQTMLSLNILSRHWCLDDWRRMGSRRGKRCGYYDCNVNLRTEHLHTRTIKGRLAFCFLHLSR